MIIIVKIATSSLFLFFFLILDYDMPGQGYLGDSAYSLPGGMNDFDMFEEPDKMTYTEQANKRGHCRRLTW